MQVNIKGFEYHVEDDTLVVRLDAEYTGTWASPLKFAFCTLYYLEDNEWKKIADDMWTPPLTTVIGTYTKTYEFRVTARRGRYRIVHEHVPVVGTEDIIDFDREFEIGAEDIGMSVDFDVSFIRTGDRSGKLVYDIKTSRPVTSTTQVIITIAHESWENPRDWMTYMFPGTSEKHYEIDITEDDFPTGKFRTYVKVGVSRSDEKVFAIDWKEGSLTEKPPEEEKGDTLSKILDILKTVSFLMIIGMVVYFVFKFIVPMLKAFKR